MGFFFFFFLSREAQAVVLKQKIIINRINLSPQFTTRVSARVGGYLFNIEGLTSPWAKVEFYSTQGNVNLTTIANQKGVFRFTNALMPLSTGDFCFLSIDTDQRASPPLCFAPPPPQTKTNISGIILPPTLTLDKSVFRQGEMVAARGKTTPYSQVRIYLFEEENPPFWELLDVFVPKIFAREGPRAVVTADSQGNFAFNLPSFKSSRWRLFVGTQRTQWGDNPSPRSNILTFASLSWWRWFLLSFFSSLLLLLSRLLNFLSQPSVIILLLFFAIGAMIHLIKSSPPNSKKTPLNNKNYHRRRRGRAASGSG